MPTLQLSNLVDVCAERLFVDPRAVDLLALHARDERDVPASDSAPQRVAHLGFPSGKLVRQLDRRIEESMIDRANLDCDSRGTHRTAGGPESRHAFYHIVAPILRNDNEICQSTRHAYHPVNAHRTP